VVSEWLSEEWLIQSAAAVALGREFDGVVQVTVTGRPGGELRYYRTYGEGRVVGGGLGATEDPGVALTLPEAEAREILEGRLDPSVAFMQGRLKTAGDNGLLLDYLAAWSSPAGVASIGRIRAVSPIGEGPSRKD
jgi:hypothetical protein